MKKSKFLKILAPIVALGLLIGALFTVSASATTDEGAAEAKAPEIISMNVEYGSELYLYYAVDKGDAEGTPKLEVLSDAEGTEIEYTVTYYTTETVHDKECYVFKTNGVAPKELNKAQYVRAVVGEEASEIKAASVELYLNTRLYKNGFAAKTAADGKDYTRRNLYYQLLKYGNSAQKLLIEGDFEAIGKPGIYVVGGSDLNGGYTAGNYVALKAAAVEGKTFSYWKVEEYSVFGEALGTKLLGDGYEYVLRRSAVITPVYDAEDTSEVELWDENVFHFNYLPSQLEYSATLTDDTREITSDPEDESNNALKLIPATKTYTITYNINNATIPENANVAVAEFRLWYDGYDKYGVNKYTAEIYFGENNSTGKKGHASFFYLTGTQVKAYKATSSSTHSPAVNSSSSALTYREWLDIRIEYRAIEADEGTVTPQWMVYINDDLVITYEGMYGTNYQDGTQAIPAATNLTRFQFNLSNSNVSGSVYLDDLSVYYLAE